MQGELFGAESGKRCIKCAALKPRTQFYRADSGICKPCVLRSQKSIHRVAVWFDTRFLAGIGRKRCSECGIAKDASGFCNKVNMESKSYAKCKDCKAAFMARRS